LNDPYSKIDVLHYNNFKNNFLWLQIIAFGNKANFHFEYKNDTFIKLISGYF